MRLIEADVLFSILHDRMNDADSNTAYDTLYDLKMELEDEVETIEDEPVRSGHWLYTEAWPHRVYCSVCYRTYALKHWQVWEDGSLARAYCPNCGAKMEEKDG